MGGGGEEKEQGGVSWGVGRWDVRPEDLWA